jgi:serine/threonine protein phosphatase PrpC
MEPIGRIHQQVKASNVRVSGVSDVGRIRTENQDAIYLDKEGHFVLLADGMGGHERGAEASQTIIEILKEFLQPEKILSELKDITNVEGAPAEIICLFSLVDKGVNKANSVLFERNRKAGLERYMGATLVGMVPVSKEHILWFHVGDSRLYRWRDSALRLLTRDHSAFNEWVREGRSGTEPTKNIVTRAIGPKEGVVTDIEWETCKEKDIYILCSDGLHDMLSDEEIAGILKSNDNVDKIAVSLVDAAIEAGGKDNTSVVVLRV